MTLYTPLFSSSIKQLSSALKSCNQYNIKPPHWKPPPPSSCIRQACLILVRSALVFYSSFLYKKHRENRAAILMVTRLSAVSFFLLLSAFLIFSFPAGLPPFPSSLIGHISCCQGCSCRQQITGHCCTIACLDRFASGRRCLASASGSCSLACILIRSLLSVCGILPG